MFLVKWKYDGLSRYMLFSPKLRYQHQTLQAVSKGGGQSRCTPSSICSKYQKKYWGDGEKVFLEYVSEEVLERKARFCALRTHFQDVALPITMFLLHVIEI